MALFHEIVFLEMSRRHALRLFNQQNDDVMFVTWSDMLGDYDFDCSPAEARRLGHQWGGDRFDAREFLAIARRDLPVRDRKAGDSG